MQMEHNFKKKFGQNFLSDTNLLFSIIKDSKVKNNDVVVEIGTGAGALTKVIAQNAKFVYSYEIDKDLEPIIKNNLDGVKNCKVIFEDFLKADTSFLPNSFAVVANLPYYITSPIITKLLLDKRAKSITIMVQNEVADRIVATPKTKDYGVLSIMVQLAGKPEKVRKVSRKMFVPSPNVDSAIVRITDINAPDDYDKIINFAKICFQMRRKTLINNLTKVYPKLAAEKAITSVGLPLNIRPEELSPQTFCLLYHQIEQK